MSFAGIHRAGGRPTATPVLAVALASAVLLLSLAGCAGQPSAAPSDSAPERLEASDISASSSSSEAAPSQAQPSSSSSSSSTSSSSSSSSAIPSSSSNSPGSSSASSSSNTAARPPETAATDASALKAALPLVEDYRASFVHGEKPAQYQKYIVLHDTEGEGSAAGVVDYWDGNGAGVAAHFVVNKDGSIVQCVPLDKITHHAGFGDTGHNALYGIVEDGRDDMVGTTPIGSWASDYGMNAWSVGIEMVHVGGSGVYPEAQLAAVDALIAYIDAYFGSESAIIDHKAWRSGNSDTSPEFAGYLANYQAHRTHA